MKNFSDLLATELTLNVVVNGHATTVGLMEPMTFRGDAVVTVDGIEVLPKFWHLSKDGVLEIDEPFYRWYHRASHQGWLLTPH